MLIEIPEELGQYDSIVKASEAGDVVALENALADNYWVICNMIAEAQTTIKRYGPRRQAILNVFKAVTEMKQAEGVGVQS